MDKKDCVVPPEEFFKNWGGNSNGGMKPKFTNAEGTSLNSGQLRRLTESKVPVIRPKEADFLKVFVPGPNGSLKSVIIHRDELKDLADDLLLYGIEFSVRDRRNYGID